MKYLFCLCVLFIAACSSNEEKPAVKTYSEETNRAFEMIERGGSYYLKKAPTSNVSPPQIKSPAPKDYARLPPVKKVTPPQPPEQKEEIVIDEKINYQEKAVSPTPAPTHTPQVNKTKNTAKVDERLVEINQNLAFYCMKHRKDPAFGDDESKCMTFVNKTLKDCQKVHHIVNSKLLSCIQTKLKNRR